MKYKNKLLIISEIIYFIVDLFCACILLQGFNKLILAVAVIALIIIVWKFITNPHSIYVSENEITIYYAFGLKESGGKDDIAQIEICDANPITPWNKKLYFIGMKNGSRFYQDGTFPYTKKLCDNIGQNWKITVNKNG